MILRRRDGTIVAERNKKPPLKGEWTTGDVFYYLEMARTSHYGGFDPFPSSAGPERKPEWDPNGVRAAKTNHGRRGTNPYPPVGEDVYDRARELQRAKHIAERLVEQILSSDPVDNK